MNNDNFKSISDKVKEELEKSDSGEKTSFQYIVHEIPSTSLVDDGEVFQVLALGGSVFLNSILKKQGQHFHALNRVSKYPGVFDSKEKFLNFIEEEIDDNVKTIALNFAYPMIPIFEKGKLDGSLVMGSKENTFEGLQGQKVGEEIEKHIKDKKNKDINVSVANDTICLLLSGLTEVGEKDIAAGILGTGMNFAIFKDKNHPVNLEAANFDKFEQTETGKIIDERSTKPGLAKLEKEVSGAYLYKHFNLALSLKNIDFPPISNTKELDSLLHDKRSSVYPIAKELIDTSAGFVSSVIAGITKYKNKDMTFVMEGSLFWSAREYRRTVKNMLIDIVPEHQVTFIKVEDSPIFGAAKLVA